MNAVPTLVLTGTVGAGKTMIAEAISELLRERGIRHALIELDRLGQMYPPLDADDPFDLSLALRNLAVTSPIFVTAGIESAVGAQRRARYVVSTDGPAVASCRPRTPQRQKPRAFSTPWVRAMTSIVGAGVPNHCPSA